MRTGLKLYVLVAALVVHCLPLNAAEVPEGRPAPKATMKLLNAGKVSPFPGWEIYRGRVVVLEFWATDCAPCVANIPHMNALQKELAGKPVSFVSVTYEKGDDITKFLKRHPISGDIGVEGGETSKAFGVNMIPQIVLIGADGSVLRYTVPQELNKENLALAAESGKVQDIRHLMLTKDESPKKEASLPDLFEVRVSSPSEGAKPGYGRMSGRGFVTLNFTALPFRRLAARAWETSAARLDISSAVSAQTFDFVVKVPSASEDSARPLLREAIKAAYGVGTRAAARRGTALVLRRDKEVAAGLKPSGMKFHVEDYGRAYYRSKGVTMREFSLFLEDHFGTPVTDATRLDGRYDLDMEWSVAGQEGLRKALSEKLGMSLNAEEAEIDVLEIFAEESAAGVRPINLLLESAFTGAGKVDASLLSAAASARPGESFSAGLRLKMRDGWHVYWRNPGDAGLAPSLSWSLPSGWTASEPGWPAPERIKYQGINNFGYSGEVVLPLTITVPDSAVVGSKSLLKARVEWLECRENCVPGAADLWLDIPVSSESRANAKDAAALAASLTALPRRADTGVSAERDGDNVKLRFGGRHPLAEFFPYSSESLMNGRPVASVSPTGTELSLELLSDKTLPARIEGVLLRPGLPPVEISVPLSAAGASKVRILLMAFVGGLLLNLMPCVLPVLAFKAVGLLNRKGRSPSLARLESIAYSAGVLLCCEALAGALLVARRAGETLGWGTQFQSPWVVGALALLFVLAGLSMFGVFKVGARWIGVGSSLSALQGVTGAFFSGVFAMVAGAPCTAPFMGATLGWAMTRPGPEVLVVFAALGLGMALPYAAVSAWPAFIRLIPRPGQWMVTLKKLLSLPMFATAAWLLFVLWRLVTPAPAVQDLVWREWSPEAVAAARAAGDTVMVDFTAAWCLSCQVNEHGALAAPEVRTALSAPGVAAFRADWTGRDKRIQEELARYGRNGVPLYVVHPAGGPAVLLSELLTADLVLSTLPVRRLSQKIR